MYQPIQEAGPLSMIRNVTDLILGLNNFRNRAGRSVSSGYNKTNPSKSSNYKYSSVAKAASNLIAVFPIICSKNVDSDTAQMVSKYIESKCCIMLQMAIQSASIDSAMNGMDYLKNFHQNIDFSSSGIDIYLKSLDEWINGYEESASFEIPAERWNKLLEMMNEMHDIKAYDSNLNPVSLNDYIVHESSDNYRVELKLSNFNEDGVNIKGVSTGILKDQDIKKMNAGVPSLIYVKFHPINNSGETSNVTIDFWIGVKANVIGVNSDEILRRIMNDNKDGKSFINILRMMSGELKATDFLFGLSRIDEDLKSVNKKGAYGNLWKLLQNRADAARDQMRNGKITDYAAISTVIITKNDANELYKEENVDIENPKIARHFMKSYNLLAFGIVDNATESVKILFDDDNNFFEEYSYRTLQRDNDEQYKSMINLLTKMK